MKRLGLSAPADAIRVHVATSRRDLIRAFHLVYRSYLAKGYIRPNPARVVYREAFGLSSTRTCIATDPVGKLLGTVTLVGDSFLGLDVERTHLGEIEHLRAQGRKIAEVTCLAIRSHEVRPSLGVYFALTRFLVQFAYRRGVQDLVLTIHPRHKPFYRRHFAAATLGPVRAHPSVNGHPAVCCRIDLEALSGRVDPRLWRRYFAESIPEFHFTEPPVRPEDHRWLTAAAHLVPGPSPVSWRRSSQTPTAAALPGLERATA